MSVLNLVQIHTAVFCLKHKKISNQRAKLCVKFTELKRIARNTNNYKNVNSQFYIQIESITGFHE